MEYIALLPGPYASREIDFVPGGLVFDNTIYDIIISQLSNRRRCPHTAESCLTAEKGLTKWFAQHFSKRLKEPIIVKILRFSNFIFQTIVSPEMLHLQAEKEQLRAEKAHLQAEKEQLQAEKEQLQAEREQLQAEKVQLKAVKEHLQAEKEQLQANKSTVMNETVRYTDQLQERIAELSNDNQALLKRKEHGAETTCLQCCTGAVDSRR